MHQNDEPRPWMDDPELSANDRHYINSIADGPPSELAEEMKADAQIDRLGALKAKNMSPNHRASWRRMWRAQYALLVLVGLAVGVAGIVSLIVTYSLAKGFDLWRTIGALVLASVGAMVCLSLWWWIGQGIEVCVKNLKWLRTGEEQAKAADDLLYRIQNKIPTWDRLREEWRRKPLWETVKVYPISCGVVIMLDYNSPKFFKDEATARAWVRDPGASPER